MYWLVIEKKTQLEIIECDHSFFSILVCRTSIKSDGGNHFCVQQQHKRCVHCSPSDCVLCNFCQSRFLPSMNFDNPPANIQPIVLFCDAVEKKFEEIQSNNPDYNKQESADMDVDYNSISTTESKFFVIDKNNSIIFFCFFFIIS